MSEELQKVRDQSDYNSDYYGKNKDAISVRRKAIYATRVDVREKAKAAAAEYRKLNPKPARSGTPIYKEVEGVLTQVYRIGRACLMAGISMQTLRKWESIGRVPPPLTIEGATHRYYTEHQIILLKELAQTCSEVRYNALIRKKEVQLKSNEIHKSWKDL